MYYLGIIYENDFHKREIDLSYRDVGGDTQMLKRKEK